jgi:putative flippase GtrA
MHTRITQDEFIRFLLVGGVAAGLNFASRIIFSIWLNLTVSVILAYLTGMAVAYGLNRIYSFRQTGEIKAEGILIFLLINIISVLQIWVATTLLNQLFQEFMHANLSEMLSHFLALLVPVLPSYFCHKYLSF